MRSHSALNEPFELSNLRHARRNDKSHGAPLRAAVMIFLRRTSPCSATPRMLNLRLHRVTLRKSKHRNCRG